MRLKKTVSLALAALVASAGIAYDWGPGVMRVSASLNSQKNELLTLDISKDFKSILVLSQLLNAKKSITI